MGNVLVIPENLLATTYGQAVASSEASASMADDNLLTEEPSEFWRSTDNQPLNNILRLSLNGMTTVSASALAFCGHNLRRGDQYRVILRNASSVLGGEILYPTGTASVTNSAANPHTFLDSDLTDWITPTVAGSDWGFQVTFATPSNPPQNGTDRQSVWAYVKAASAVSYGTIAPTVQCIAYLPDGLGGFNTVNCGTKTIKSSTGQWVFWAFDFATCAVASGAGVKIELLFSDRDLSLAGGTASNGHVAALYWNADTVSDLTTISGGELNGWYTYEPFSGSGITYKPEVKGASESILIQFGSVLQFRLALIQIRSDHSPVDIDSTAEVLPTPAGYVQIGCVVMGEAWQPTYNIAYGKLVGGLDMSSKSRTYGGQKFGSRRPVRRILPVELRYLTPAECHTLFDRVVWRNGILRSFFVSLLPDDATQSKHTGFLASIKNPETWIGIQPHQGYENSMVLEFEEDL